MITGCEVATAFCRKAAALAAEADPAAEAYAAMSRTHARTVLADVRRGSVQCAAGFVTEDDTTIREALETFVSELESGDAIRVHRGLLLDLDVVTAHLKQL
jgi:hypothetical protein